MIGWMGGAAQEERLDRDTVELLLSIAALREDELRQAKDPLRFVDPVLREWRGFRRFATEQLKIVDVAEQLVPLVLNATQRAIVAAEIRARRAKRPPWFIILKSRKRGVTTLQQALAYWAIWRQQHASCLTLVHRDKEVRPIFHKVELFWEHQPPDQRHGKTAAATYWIQFPGWDGSYLADTAGAQEVARGSTLSRVHVSEAAFAKNLRHLHKGLVDVLVGGAYVLESTPNGREGVGEAFYEFWQTAARGQSQFIPLFFPWFTDVRNRLPLLEPDELDPLTDREAYLQRTHTLTLEQVKWWRQKRMALMADGQSADAVESEHPSDTESCFSYSSPGYYDRDLLAAAEQRCLPPIRVEENGRLRIWEAPQPGAFYVLGVDPAEGVGADDSAIVGFNALTRRQAFSWAWNRIPPDELGRLVIGNKETGLGWRWRNPSTDQPAFVIVERINHGHAVLTGLLKLAEYPRDRVYHHLDPAVDPRGIKPAKRPGWPHDHVQLTTEVGRMLREASPLVLDAQVVRSIRAVGAGTNGAEFSGRDLAVAAGIGAIGIPYAQESSDLMYVGGKVVRMGGGPLSDDTADAVP